MAEKVRQRKPPDAGDGHLWRHEGRYSGWWVCNKCGCRFDDHPCFQEYFYSEYRDKDPGSKVVPHCPGYVPRSEWQIPPGGG